MDSYFGHVWLVRLLLQRGLAAVYLIAFIVAANQFKPLLGERGLLPVRDFLKRASFWDAPSIFHWRYSDRLLGAVAWTGIIVSSVAVIGLSGPLWLSVSTWVTLWVL